MKGCDVSVMVAVPSTDSYTVFEHTGIMAVGGSELDLVDRIVNAARQVEANTIVRVTADNVLACPRMIEATIASHYAMGKPFTVNWKTRRFPNGMDLEVYDAQFLENLNVQGADREWFASWCVNKLPGGAVNSIVNPDDLSSVRMTLDYPEDLEFMRKVFKAMGNEVWDVNEILTWLDRHPGVVALNKKYNKEYGAKPK